MGQENTEKENRSAGATARHAAKTVDEFTREAPAPGESRGRYQCIKCGHQGQLSTLRKCKPPHGPGRAVRGRERQCDEAVSLSLPCFPFISTVTGATIAIWLALCQHYSIVLKWVYFVFHFRSLNSS